MQISAHIVRDDGGRTGLVLTLIGQSVDAHIRLHREEIDLIPGLKPPQPSERRSIALGWCAGSPAVWVADARGLAILIGPGEDAANWDVCVTMPLAAIDEIHHALALAAASASEEE